MYFVEDLQRGFPAWWAQTRITLQRTAFLYAMHWSASVWSRRELRSLVGSSGLEPPTSRLSGARSNHLSYEPISLFRCLSFSLALFYWLQALSSSSSPSCENFVSVVITPCQCCRSYRPGGDDGIRTHDPLLAGQVLSQLSYTPLGVCEFPLQVTQNWTTTDSYSQQVSLSRRL